MNDSSISSIKGCKIEKIESLNKATNIYFLIWDRSAFLMVAFDTWITPIYVNMQLE